VIALDTALILFVLTLLAGLVDTIAGGGRLISVPALYCLGHQQGPDHLRPLYRHRSLHP